MQVWGKYMIIGYLDPEGKGEEGTTIFSNPKWQNASGLHRSSTTRVSGLEFKGLRFRAWVLEHHSGAFDTKSDASYGRRIKLLNKKLLSAQLLAANTFAWTGIFSKLWILSGR